MQKVITKLWTFHFYDIYRARWDHIVTFVLSVSVFATYCILRSRIRKIQNVYLVSLSIRIA